MPNPKTTIIFDFDGTLINSFEGHVKVYARTFEYFNINFDLDHFLKTYSPDWTQTYIAFGLPRKKWNTADAKWVEESEKESYLLYEDSYEVIKNLHKKYKLGIVTSGSKERVQKDLETHKIEHYFESLVTGNDVTNQKPHPEGLIMALKELTTKPENAVYIGDTPVDFQMAQNTGVDFIGLKSKFTRENGSAKFYDTLTEIYNLL